MDILNKQQEFYVAYRVLTPAITPPRPIRIIIKRNEPAPSADFWAREHACWKNERNINTAERVSF